MVKAEERQMQAPHTELQETTMADLVELNPKDHRHLKVKPDCAIQVARNQHLINIKVNEVGNAMTCFPIFITRAQNQSDWSISAVTSFEVDGNLFVKDVDWDASYIPSGMQTYPFFLMNSPTKERQFTMGIDVDNPAFSEDDGEAIFVDENKASDYLSRVATQLESDIKNEYHSFQFVHKLEELDLIKPMDLQVHYQHGAVNTLKGLHTVDEEKLQKLDIDQLEELRTKGYLGPIYGMLMSIYQLNALLKRHNQYGDLKPVVQVKLDPAKDEAATEA